MIAPVAKDRRRKSAEFELREAYALQRTGYIWADYGRERIPQDYEERMVIGRLIGTGEPFLLTEGDQALWYPVSDQWPQPLRNAIRREFRQRRDTGLFAEIDLRASDLKIPKPLHSAFARKIFDEVWTPKYVGNWPQAHVVLDVPYDERESVKQLGGVFDRVIQRWRVRSDRDLTAFERWRLPSQKTHA